MSFIGILTYLQTINGFTCNIYYTINCQVAKSRHRYLAVGNIITVNEIIHKYPNKALCFMDVVKINLVIPQLGTIGKLK